MGKIFLVSFLGFFITSSYSAIPDRVTQKNVKYKTFMGQCPSKASAEFALLVMKEFEKNQSLKEVKERILKEKLDERYFLSDYRVSYNPVKKLLSLKLDCPEPLMKVQIYKTTGEEHYSAILGENARLYDPGYENLLKTEKRLNRPLPLLAISASQLEQDAPQRLVNFIRPMSVEMRQLISEIIMSKNNELTIVFALGGKATSVFMGNDQWDEKLVKLTKIMNYAQKNKRYPGSINLVNAKKVVVKFSDKI